LLPAVKDESPCIYTYLFYENLQIHIKLGLSENLIKSENEIVIFVLSAQNDCILLGHENESLVETVKSRLQTHSNAPTKQSSFARNTNTIFSTTAF
jgi:hypothetical protein